MTMENQIAGAAKIAKYLAAAFQAGPRWQPHAAGQPKVFWLRQLSGGRLRGRFWGLD
jgi:hypothetical protein